MKTFCGCPKIRCTYQIKQILFLFGDGCFRAIWLQFQKGKLSDLGRIYISDPLWNWKKDPNDKCLILCFFSREGNESWLGRYWFVFTTHFFCTRKMNYVSKEKKSLLFWNFLTNRT